MARYTGPSCRLCRREGMKLFLKGERCATIKCAMERRAYAPGQHGQMKKKISPYAMQLREKQKLRRIYGILEAQCKNYFLKAEKQKGITGENLLRLLERRLDNVVYKMGLASSRNQARQMVTHGHFEVDGRKVDRPSFLVKPGNVISLKESSREKANIRAIIEQAKGKKSIPSWMEVDTEKMEGRILNLPTREEMEVQIQEQLIVEFYSR